MFGGGMKFKCNDDEDMVYGFSDDGALLFSLSIDNVKALMQCIFQDRVKDRAENEKMNMKFVYQFVDAVLVSCNTCAGTGVVELPK
jgi:hypothetical protein